VWVVKDFANNRPELFEHLIEERLVALALLAAKRGALLSDRALARRWERNNFHAPDLTQHCGGGSM
jgi:hypothetical protein